MKTIHRVLSVILLFVTNLSVLAQGQLWGVTQNGGATQEGVVFSMDQDGTNYSYQSEGKNPKSGLTVAYNGRLYGLTDTGGLYNTGQTYEVDPAAALPFHGYKAGVDLGPFGNGLGAVPTGSFTNTTSHKLYAITTQRGANTFGAIIELEAGAQVVGSLYTYTPRYYFTYEHALSDLQYSMIQASNGKLYGITPKGGVNGEGILFEFNLSGFVFTKKIDFSSVSSGQSPTGGLVEASNGKLYGITNEGGANNYGVLFEYDPITNVLVKKVDFDGIETGANPRAALMKASNGKLYGMTSGGGVNGDGVIFEFDPLTGVLAKRFDFDSAVTGENPKGGLSQSPNGKIYGTTFSGGVNNLGVLFEFDSETNAFVKKLDFDGLNGANPVGTLAYNMMKSQTINFAALDSKVYGDAPFILNATASSGYSITYSSSNPAVATISGITVTIVGSGTARITASQPGNSKFYPAVSVTQDLIVSQASATVTLSNLSQTYDAAPKPVTITTAPTGVSVQVKYNESSTVPTAAGSYAVEATISNPNYTGSATGTLIINKAVLTVTADNKSRVYNTSNPALTLSYSGFKGSDNVSSLSTLPTATTAATTTSNAGVYPITISGGTAANYSLSPVSGALTITKANQVITFNTIPNQCQGASVALAATSSSGLPVSYSSSNLGIAGISGNSLTGVGSGITTIIASQTGNVNYDAALSVVQSITIISAPQPSITKTNDFCTNTYVKLTATNVIGAVSYRWSTGQTTSFINVYTAGTYTVTVNYLGGCSRTSDVYTLNACAPTPPEPCIPNPSASASATGREIPCLPETAIKSAETVLRNSIHPNPSDQELTVDLTYPAKSDVQITMYSPLGQMVKSVVIFKGETNTTMDTRELVNGVYLVQIEAPGVGMIKKRAVISHK